MRLFKEIIADRLFMFTIVTAVALTACSEVTARKPAPKTLTVPERPSGTGFGLSGETPSGLFRGGLLIWSPEVNAGQIETLLRATRETNEKYVALNRYFTSFQEKEVNPLKRSIEDKKSRYAVLKSESDERSAATQIQRASVWFAQETDALRQRFPALDVARSEAVFRSYCEAKIVDLATRSFLPTTKFRSRPTPSAICEPFYQGRFFTGESCQADSSGRNYYDCIWKEGVLKTAFAQRIQIRVASTLVGTKAASVLSLSEFSTLPIVKDALALNDVQFCTASLMRSKILSGVKYRVLANGNIIGGFTCGENSRFEISYGVGEWDKELAKSSAGFLIDSVEVRQASNQLPAEFQWVAPEVAAADRELAAAVQSVVSKVALFHAGVGGCNGEFNSPNDVYFNDARLSDGVSLQGQCKSMLPPLDSIPGVIVVDQDLEKMRLDLGALERDLAGLKGNSCPVSPSCEGVAAGHARCDFLNAQVRKAAAAEARGVASVLVTDFALSFERASPTATTVVVWMNNAAVGVGCVGEAKLGVCTGSTTNQGLSSAAPVQAEISKNEELVLKLKIDSRQMSSAGVPESVVRQFVAFNDMQLEINASINSFDGVVPYLSGKAFVRSEDGGKPLAEGSVSYLIENSFDRKLGEFCSVN
ncbi:MAG: hypothetical protein RLZZ488_367 [Pseudomonadota bacterium]|jgi:hypothetical protein